MDILLVDNKKDVLDTMGEILEVCQNHRVQAAASGKEAFRLMRRKKYDLIIIELALPLMNGLEVISRIRKTNTRVKILVLTTITINDAIREKLKKLDVQKVFVKPRGIHDLLQHVKQMKTSHTAIA